MARLTRRLWTDEETQTARLWTYARDERPWGGTAPPATWYRFSGDRKGQHPEDHLARFRGWMHADGYAGFEDLYRSGAIREVACMAHVRRKFVDIHRAQASPIAEEAIARIAQLYAVEKEARGSPPACARCRVEHPCRHHRDDIPNSDPPAVRVISDNPLYPAYESTADEIRIIGRIRWFAREI